MYLSQIANVFVSICKVYLSQIAKCICLKLQSVFVSNFKCICPKLLNNIFVEWKVATSSDVQEEEEMHQGSATISWLHKIAKNSKKNGNWFVFPLFSCARALMMYIKKWKDDARSTQLLISDVMQVDRCFISDAAGPIFCALSNMFAPGCFWWVFCNTPNPNSLPSISFDPAMLRIRPPDGSRFKSLLHHRVWLISALLSTELKIYSVCFDISN